MKLAAVLALAVVGSSSRICRELQFRTGVDCPYGWSPSEFKIMPFDVSVPSKCRDRKGASCVVKVCGTQGQFSKPFEVVAEPGKVNSWNFDVYTDELADRLKPKSICSTGSKKEAWCCGALMRMDPSTRRASYTWPVSGRTKTQSPSSAPSSIESQSPSSAPSPSPSAAPSARTDLPSSAPTSLQSRAPTLLPTSTSDPTASPSRSLTTSPSRSPSATPSRPPTRASEVPKSCNGLSFDECKANEFCKASNGKKGKKPCGEQKCKKFKKSLSKCKAAPHCKPGKVKDGRLTKCLKVK